MSRSESGGRESEAERWQRVRAVAEEALELEEPARAALLARMCGDDGTFRAEVERLIDGCERAARAGDFLGQSASAFAEPLVSADAARASRTPDASPDPLMLAQLQAELSDRYVVERQIGAGGMATVFAAEDRKHGRRVAIKLLRTDVGAALDVDRFVSEIRFAAGLQHPNLMPLFDSGGSGDLRYYVMPYVEGESLRERLIRERQLPVSEAVRITTAVAGALDYAHRQGVIHRDLKPENILLHDGQPLLADFGIALAIARAGDERLTQAGTSLGTPRYMSPEQAAAELAIDARSDIYSLACVLYEMLTGAPPRRNSVGLGASGASQPTPRASASRPDVPPRVDDALARALATLPSDRFSTAREFADALAGLGDADGGAAAASAAAGASAMPTARRSRAGMAAAVAVAAVAVIALVRREPPARPATRFVVDALSDSPRERTPTLTPDGQYLVYVGSAAAQRRIMVRPLDQLRARELAGTEGAISSFVSADGRWIGFFTSDDKLKKVPLAGGPPTLIGGAFRYSKARWSADGRIISDSYGSNGLFSIDADGGTPRPLTRVDTVAGESRHTAPLITPDGRAVIFTSVRERSGPGTVLGDLAMASLQEGPSGAQVHRRLGVRGREAVAVVDGWLLYVSESRTSLLAVRLDQAAQRAAGAPVTVLEDSVGGIEGVVLSNDGTLLYTRRSARNQPQLVDLQGNARPLLSTALGASMNPRVSPDGRRLAIQAASAEGNDVWIYDLASGTPTRLTSNGSSQMPMWTPDGTRIVYLDVKVGTSWWWRPADGSAPPVPIVEAPGALSGAITPDGKLLVFERLVNGGWEIWSVGVDGPPSLRPLVTDVADDLMPALSPDGRWLAYVSNASGRQEVYVRPLGGPGAATQLSDSGGTEPVWAPDGRRLFYRSPTAMMAATLSFQPQPSLTRRDRLFADRFETEMPHVNYDILPDGKRLMMVAPSADAGPQTVVVLNWLPELRGRLAGE